MEGYTSVGERNGSKTAFEFNIAFVSLLLLGPLVRAEFSRKLEKLGQFVPL